MHFNRSLLLMLLCLFTLSTHFGLLETLFLIFDIVAGPWLVIGLMKLRLARLSEVSTFSTRRKSQMQQFLQALDDCYLFDLGFKGPIYTYSNKRANEYHFQARLDRPLVNRQLFPLAQVHHLSTFSSGHKPLLLKVLPEVPHGHKQFYFEPRWITKYNISALIDNWWDSTHQLPFKEKVSKLRNHLTVWNRSEFGNVQD